VVEYLEWYIGLFGNPDFNQAELGQNSSLLKYALSVALGLFVFSSNETPEAQKVVTHYDVFMNKWKKIELAYTKEIGDFPPTAQHELQEALYDHIENLNRLKDTVRLAFMTLAGPLSLAAACRLESYEGLRNRFGDMSELIGAEKKALALESIALPVKTGSAREKDIHRLINRVLYRLKALGIRKAILPNGIGYCRPVILRDLEGNRIGHSFYYTVHKTKEEFEHLLEELCDDGVWKTILREKPTTRAALVTNVMKALDFPPTFKDDLAFSWSDGIFDMATCKYWTYSMIENLSATKCLSLERFSSKCLEMHRVTASKCLEVRNKRHTIISKSGTKRKAYSKVGENEDDLSKRMKTLESLQEETLRRPALVQTSEGTYQSNKSRVVGEEEESIRKEIATLTRQHSRVIHQSARSGAYDLREFSSRHSASRDEHLKSGTFATNNFFEQDMAFFHTKHILRLSERSVVNLPLFALFQLFHAQKFSKEVIEAILMMDGRLFHDFRLDDWQFMQWVLGPGQTGKSTYLNYLSSLFSAEDKASLADRIEEMFGWQGMIGKKLIIGNDINKHFNLNPSMWNNAISGEDQAIAVKHKEAVSGALGARWVIGGNTFPKSFDNEQGQTERRIALLLFRRHLPDADSEIKQRIRLEKGPFLLASALLYRWMVSKFGHKGPWTFLPSYFHSTKKFVMGRTNSLYLYLTSSEVVIFNDLRKSMDKEAHLEIGVEKKSEIHSGQYRHSRRKRLGKEKRRKLTIEEENEGATQFYGCPLDFLEWMYGNWCKKTGLNKVEWKKEVYDSVFSALGLTLGPFHGLWPDVDEEKHRIRLDGGSTFVYGCMIRNVHLALQEERKKQNKDNFAVAPKTDGPGHPSQLPVPPPVPLNPPVPPIATQPAFPAELIDD
jgi:hypothetical protein